MNRSLARAFTLAELLVVIAIIGILMGMGRRCARLQDSGLACGCLDWKEA